MDSFNKLLDVAKTLLGPKGCPWDQKQTLNTLQPYLLEEIHELIEAIDLNDPKKIKEELGDAFYTIIFVSMLADKEGLCTLNEAILSITEKLIRRHPHVFGDVKVKGVEDVMQNWDEIKMQEGRKSPFEGIPPTLPALAKAQKTAEKLRRMKKIDQKTPLMNEEELGEKLWEIVEKAESYGIDAESALRKAVNKKTPEINL